MTREEMLTDAPPSERRASMNKKQIYRAYRKMWERHDLNERELWGRMDKDQLYRAYPALMTATKRLKILHSEAKA